MLCDVCKTKKATVFLTQMVEGNVQKLNLCEPCSKLQGVHDPIGLTLADLLLGLGATQEVEKSVLSCPLCGFSQSDFKKRGRLGCSACYDTFVESLSIMLRNMHRGVVHTGKVPAKIAAAYQKALQLEMMKKSLATAISNEEYEEAARYRDLIYEFEAGLLDTNKTDVKEIINNKVPPSDLEKVQKANCSKEPPPLSPSDDTPSFLL